MSLQNPLERDLFIAPGIIRVSWVDHLVRFVTRDANFPGIGHHDKIPGIHMGRVRRLVLTHKGYGYLGGKPAQYLVGRIHMEPLVLHIRGFGRITANFACRHNNLDHERRAFESARTIQSNRL